MSDKEIPNGWPDIQPVYDIQKSYLENAEEGPFFTGTFLPRTLPPEKEWTDFLGFKVASPIGVPAGPLLNARWTNFAAKMGFDIVTYKTIRSNTHPAHPVPNMVYVETHGYLNSNQEGQVLKVAHKPSSDMNHLAVTNSFGIPSRDPDYLIKDIAEAQKGLGRGQVMIVSIVGTPREGEDFVEDFVVATKLAIAGGAKIIEADFSCPNVISCEGSIHTNPESVYLISSRIKKAIGSVPLIIKVGAIVDPNVLKKVMEAAARAGVEAICGINTLSMKVVNDEGVAALGPKRERAGVCGGPIRMAAIDFIENSYKINKSEKLGLNIMATGGVTDYRHFDLFFEKGADVAMSAIGMLWDPYLAARYHAFGSSKWRTR
jgi:dihydroorotate dehydrogenase (NAD+) catalytic subunit